MALPAPSRLALWALLAAPGGWIAGRYATDAISYGQVIHETGDWAVWLLLVTLAVTPARLAFRGQGWVVALVRWRRNLGVATFAYAAFHLAVYLVRKADSALIAREGMQLELLVGWIAFFTFAVLAATSNDASVRGLGRGWGRLHKLVYPAAALTLAHWWLSAFDPLMATVHAAILAAIVAARIALPWARRRRAPTSA